MNDYSFPEVIEFWPDYLREQELEAQKAPSDDDCEAFDWEIEPEKEEGD